MPGTILLSVLLDIDSDGLIHARAAVAFGDLVLALGAVQAHDRTGHPA